MYITTTNLIHLQSSIKRIIIRTGVKNDLLLLCVLVKKQIKQIPLEQAFGDVLRKYRGERGFTQGQLADITGLSVSFISFCERGMQTPSLTSIFLFAKGLEVEPVDLVAEVQLLNPAVKA